MRRIGELFAGTSGWAYPSWKPGFYPEKTSAKTMLTYYASQLNSVEINHSFRKLPAAPQVEEWMTRSGPGLRLSFKAPQRITHFSRLRACQEHVAEFLKALKPAADAGRLGLVLFQLPPTFKADARLLQDFLEMPALQDETAPRIAFEFRHESWFADEIYTLLSRHDAALSIAEDDELQTPEVHTARAFAAYRLRRAGGYTADQIGALAQHVQALMTGPKAARDVFVYFKHEDEPTGALNAVALLQAAARLRLAEAKPPSASEPSGMDAAGMAMSRRGRGQAAR